MIEKLSLYWKLESAEGSGAVLLMLLTLSSK